MMKDQTSSSQDSKWSSDWLS